MIPQQLNRTTAAIAASSVFLLAPAAHAQIHAGDIAIGLVGQQLMVSNGDRDGNSQLIFDECIFGVELDSLARTTNPGFDTDAGVLIPGERIGYAYPSALRRWNGADFDTIPTERVRMSLGPVPGVSSPVTDPAQDVLGITATVNGNGEFHHHYTIRLELNGSPATDPLSEGVYLLELKLYNQSGTYETSPSFWLVFDHAAGVLDFEAAFEFARDEISTCPDDVCLADVNMDGAVTPTDFGAWLAAFNAGDSAADQNQDGMVTPTDFGAWLANFNAGCD